MTEKVFTHELSTQDDSDRMHDAGTRCDREEIGKLSLWNYAQGKNGNWFGGIYIMLDRYHVSDEAILWGQPNF